MLRPLVRRWRSMAHHSFVYIDDGIGGASDLISAKAASQVQRTDLKRAGLKANETKSHWEPVQVGEWLGIIINTIAMTFHVPQRKIDKLRALINSMVNSTSVVVKDLARLAGQIVSMTLGLGPIARLFTRQMYYRIENRICWNELIEVDSSLLEELQFWLQHVKAFNGYAISRSIASATAVVYSDASATGYGGYLVQIGNKHSATGVWPVSEQDMSSTGREMKAILYVLESFRNFLQQQTVIWFTDSSNTVRIVQHGSSKPHLQNIAVRIFNICFELHIELHVEWLPRTANQKADYLSRIVDPDDWSLSKQYFQLLDKLWGPHTIDRFASSYNNQVPRFNSRYWNPGTEAVNAFTEEWSLENNWLCPPTYLISRTINKLVRCKAKGTLIIPEWPSAVFWPLVAPGCGSYAAYIKDVHYFNPSSGIFTSGRGQQLVYKRTKSVFSGVPRFRVIALRMDCSI